MDTKRKTAVVTGASRGIGRGIADSLVKEGYQVLYVATGDSLPGVSHYAKCNIAVGADRERLLAEAKAQLRHIDVLVNNAGVAPAVRMDLLETTEESFDRLIDINLKGTFFLCQLFAKEMIAGKRPGCKIINIASVSSYASSVQRGEYCISKAGISMTTQLFAHRLAEDGIGVFEVRPGIIETDMITAVKEKYQRMIADGLTPIHRLGTPQDVANCVLACCSGLLDFSTGQVLNADGGFHIRRL